MCARSSAAGPRCTVPIVCALCSNPLSKRLLRVRIASSSSSPRLARGLPILITCLYLDIILRLERGGVEG